MRFVPSLHWAFPLYDSPFELNLLCGLPNAVYALFKAELHASSTDKICRRILWISCAPGYQRKSPILTTPAFPTHSEPIVRDEGLTGLYRGLGATLGQVAPALAINYAAYESLRATFMARHLEQTSPSVSPLVRLQSSMSHVQQQYLLKEHLASSFPSFAPSCQCCRLRMDFSVSLHLLLNEGGLILQQDIASWPAMLADACAPHYFGPFPNLFLSKIYAYCCRQARVWLVVALPALLPLHWHSLSN